MNYPKQMMRIDEMVEHTGLSKEYFKQLYRNPGVTFVAKLDPLKRNSPIMVETEAFEKWRIKQIQMEKKELRERIGA